MNEPGQPEAAPNTEEKKQQVFFPSISSSISSFGLFPSLFSVVFRFLSYQYFAMKHIFPIDWLIVCVCVCVCGH